MRTTGIRQGLLVVMISAACCMPVYGSWSNTGPGANERQTVSSDIQGPAVGGLVEEIRVEESGELGNGEASTALQITYENLEQLLLSGSLALKTRTDNQVNSKKNYQEMLDTLREEQEYMKFLAEASEEDSEEEAMYRKNASELARSASRISGQLERLNSRSSAASLQSIIDTYLVTAQSRYKSYKKMEWNAAAKAKSVEVSERTWQEMIKRQSAGLATADDVLRAADQYEQQKQALISYEQQEKEQRRQLLTLLGFGEEQMAEIQIAEVPAPDLEAVAAVDFEQDMIRAVNNNSDVQNERHSRAGTTAEIQRKAVTVEAAEGSAKAAAADAYQQLISSRTFWQAAADAYESAEISWNSVRLKKQAGMLDTAAFLQGEADYLQACADYQSASMDLLQAYEDYLWEIKGL